MTNTSSRALLKRVAKPADKNQPQPAKKKQKTTVTSFLANLNAEQKKKYGEFSKRGVLPNCYADKTALTRLGTLDEVSHLLEAIGWLKLLDLNAPTYEELVYEFLSTFEFKEFESGSHTFHFILGGEQQDFDEEKLEEVFGWTSDDQSSVPKLNEQAFWQEITMDPSPKYSSRSSKATSIVNPSYMYICKLFAYTLFGRGSVGPVSPNELVVIYCVHEGIKLDFATLFGRRMVEVVKQGEGKLMVGLFVTMLTRHAGVHLSLSTLVSMHFARRSGESYEIIAPDRGSHSADAMVLHGASQPQILEPAAGESVGARIKKLEEGLREVKDEMSRLHTTIETQFRQLDEKLSSYFKSPQPSL